MNMHTPHTSDCLLIIHEVVDLELHGCQVSTIPHERRFIDSIRNQSLAQLFVGGVDKPSGCFAIMVAKTTYFAALYSLDTKGLAVYTALSICTKIKAGLIDEYLQRRSMGGQKWPSLSSTSVLALCARPTKIFFVLHGNA